MHIRKKRRGPGWYPVASPPNHLATILGDPGAVSQVGRKLRARRKFSSEGERAPWYSLSPNYFQKFKRMLAPDWAQKCFVLLCPIGEQFLLSSFREFVHDSHCFDGGLSGSCTKEMHAVRKLSVWYKIPIWLSYLKQKSLVVVKLFCLFF